MGDIALITPFIPLILRGIVRESTLILRGRLKKSPFLGKDENTLAFERSSLEELNRHDSGKATRYIRKIASNRGRIGV